MFGSNSPRYSERASDQRVRLAHPESQIQLSNSVISYFASHQRQPLILPSSDRVVKRFDKLESRFLQPRRRSIHARPALARYCQRPATGPRRLILPASTSHPLRTAHLAIHAQRVRSRRVLIITNRAASFNPRQHNTIPDEHTSHFSSKPATTSARRIRRQPTHRAASTRRRRWGTRGVRIPHRARQYGPCRNRTYNLAIKSRLLCQLS